MHGFKNSILCVVDVETNDNSALERAVELAEANKIPLRIVDVVPHFLGGMGMPEGGPDPAEMQTAAVAEHERKLESSIAPYRNRARLNADVLVGTLFLEVIQAVLRDHSDLLVKAAENPAWLERLFGSDDMHLLRKCPCPVLLIKDKAPERYQRILAAVDVCADYSEEECTIRRDLNQQTLMLAASWAISESAELHVVAAWDAMIERAMQGALYDPPAMDVVTYVEGVERAYRQALDDLMGGFSQSFDAESGNAFATHTHLIKGSARKVVASFAKSIEAGLIVMGTVGRIGLPGLIMGNTAETILNQINCSVLAVKPTNFVSPVTLPDG